MKGLVGSAAVELERCLPLWHHSPSLSCQLPVLVFGHGGGFPGTARERQRAEYAEVGLSQSPLRPLDLISARLDLVFAS